MNSDSGAEFLLAYYLIGGFLYVIPTIVAFVRRHPNRWLIAVINLAFGATVIGWAGALIWALAALHISPHGSDGGESGLNLFVNDPVKVQVVGQSTSKPETESESKTKSKQDAEDVGDAVGELKRLQSLLTSGAIDQKEFDALKDGIVQRVLNS